MIEIISAILTSLLVGTPLVLGYIYGEHKYTQGTRDAFTIFEYDIRIIENRYEKQLEELRGFNNEKFKEN